MRLTSLRARGLKGATGHVYRLAPVVFLAGPNGAGKSTIIDALRLLVLGYHPDAGRGGQPAKTLDAVLALAAGDEIEVEGTWETAGPVVERLVARRVWSRSEVKRGARKGDVKATTSLTVTTGGKELTGDEASAALHRAVGAPRDKADSCPHLSLPGLLGPSVSDSDRRFILLQAAGARSTWSPARVAEEWTRRNLGEGTWLGEPKDRPLAEWLEARHGAAQLFATKARQTEASRREALAGLQAEAPPAVDPAEVGRLRGLHEQAEQQARAVAERTGRSEQAAADQLAQAEQAVNLRRVAQADLDTVRRQFATAAPRPDVAPLRARLADLEDGWDDGSLSDLQGAVARAECQVTERTAAANAALATAQEAQGAWQAAVALRRVRADEAGRPNAILLRIEGDKDNIDGPTCPTCQQPVTDRAMGALREAAKRAGQAFDKVEAEAEQLHEVMQRADHAWRAAGEALQTADRALAEARKRLHAGELEVERLRGQIATAEATGADAQQAALQERERALLADLQRPTPDVPLLRTALQQAQAQGRRERDQAAAAAAEALAAVKVAEKAGVIEEQIGKTRAALTQAEAEAAEAERVVEQLGTKGLMGQVLADLVAPLEQLVNAGLEGLELGTFRVALADERGHSICRLGLARGTGADQSWAPLETLSDGERASVLPVLLPALATLAGAPWRLLVGDALERLDAGRRARYLAQVVELQRSGRIDQAILAGCPDTAPEVPGVTVIRIGG